MTGEMPAPNFGQIIEELLRDGVALMPRYFSEQLVMDMRDSLPPLEHFEHFAATDRPSVFRDADRIHCLSPFFHDRKLRLLACKYLGEGAIPVRRVIQIGCAALVGHAGAWTSLSKKHRPQLEMLLYLHDVEEAAASLVYLKGSHAGRWQSMTPRSCSGPKGSIVVYDPRGILCMTRQRDGCLSTLATCWKEGASCSDDPAERG